jgi:tetratricopeptide (TPR) repeat protein
MHARVSLFVLAAFFLTAAPLRGQIVSEQARREALQFYRAGQEFLSNELFEKAADLFRRAIEKDPLLALAHYGLGQSYMGLKRYTSAVVAFTDCRDTYARLAGMALSDTVSANQRREDEIREIRDSIRMFRSTRVKTANASDTNPYVLQLESRLRDLENQRNRGVEPAKPPGEVSLALGSAYFRNGQLPEAEREWKVAIETKPNLGEAHNNLAVVYLLTMRKKEAENEVREAERAGFRVNPQLKEDIRRMSS